MWARENSRPPPRDVAVIDVGSNSVRLVLYRIEGRAIWTVFNEKVLAGLGKGVAATGRLSLEGRRQALAALKRFRAVVDGANPDQVYTAATAAIREASDGRDFLQDVRRETGLDIRVLSGEEEARYAALGVCAGASKLEGVVGDLGGSSLELSRVTADATLRGVTLPLGPFSLGAPKPLDLEVKARAMRHLSPIADQYRTETFVAVGGAWRNLALVHMAANAYPLRIVHQYEFPASEALATAQLIARQSKSSLERIPGLSKKRVETLPYAAVVLEAVIDSLTVKTVAISAYGVREGLLFEAMTPQTQALNPLVEGCAALGARLGIAEPLSPALYAWLLPLWSQFAPVFSPERDRVLLEAASHLCDIGARLHPDHRADLAFDQVLRAPIAGQNHAERSFLAVATYYRYANINSALDSPDVVKLLSPERFRRARALGAAMRLGCDLSGRTPELLARTQLELADTRLRILLQAGFADMIQGDQTRKRVSALAVALERQFEIAEEKRS